MNWLNLRLATLRAPEYIGSDPTARATWLNLTAYCAEQENGGRIVGARKWKDRQWQQTCGVMQSEVQSADLLLTWDDDDLIVWNYPAEKEEEVRDRRETAQKNGKRGGRPKAESTEKKTDNKPTLVSENNQRPKAEGEEKEKEKGKEEEPPAIPPTPPAASPPKGVSEGKQSCMVPTTPQSKRFAAIFHRQLSTLWTANEVAAYKKLGIVPEEDLAAVEGYYAAHWPPHRDNNILRHNLITFLNNFSGEVDRARAAKTKGNGGSKTGEWLDSRKVVAMPVPPEEAARIAAAAKVAAEAFRRTQRA